jgi:hypothetical protein
VAIAVVSLALAITPGPIANARFVDNPLGWTAASDQIATLTYVGFGLLSAAVVLSAASMVVRFRRSHGVEREQLKWFASAAVFAALVLAGPGTLFNATATGSPAESSGKASELLTIVAILGMPLAAGVAILRYRLYEIDRIVSRTISYAVVLGILGVLFVAVIVGLQAVLASVTSGQTVPVAASTLAVFALFQPLLRRVRRAVDRRFDRARYDAELTAAAFSERLRDEVDLGTVTADLSRTARAALSPAALGIWIRGGDE